MRHSGECLTWVPGLGLVRPVQNALRAGASSARRALLRALGWGSRLALNDKPNKPNQTKPTPDKFHFWTLYDMSERYMFHDMFVQ